MTASKDTAVTKKLVITRILNAPRELVFKLWTEPRHFAQWWGPQGFTNPVCKLDVRPNGFIYADMLAPDGTIYPMSGIFTEINSPEKLVFTGGPLDQNGNALFMVTNTVTFTETNGKTKLVLHAEVSDIKPGAEPHLAGMEVGWNQSLDRLTDCLAVPEKIERELIITRLLNAPRELVFSVWTDPDHIKNWWGPNGFTNTIHKMDVKPGGEWEFVMHGPDGTNYKNKSIFKEIVKPERIVFEHVSTPKFITTVTFEALGEKTLIRWSMLFESKEHFEQVVKAFKADEGLKQNIEKLNRYVEVRYKGIAA